jgi:riboflavin synthase
LIKHDLPTNLAIYIIKKGSITINGISLTIAEIKNNTIKIAIIPHTFENTNLSFLKNGDFVNIEVDILAKYVEKFLSTSDNKSRISLEYLQEHGF